MSCGEMQDKFELYALGELDADESARLARHVSACPSCSRSASRAGEWLGRMNAALAVELFPADLPQRPFEFRLLHMTRARA